MRACTLKHVERPGGSHEGVGRQKKTCARLHFHVSDAKRPRAASNSSDGNSGWSFIGSTSSLITNFSRAVAGAAALEGLGWVGAWDPWVLQHLQTRLGGPTGRLWDWRNLRF